MLKGISYVISEGNDDEEILELKLVLSLGLWGNPGSGYRPLV